MFKALLLPWACCCPSEPVRRRFRTVLQGVEPTVTLLRLLNEIGAIQTRPAETLYGLVICTCKHCIVVIILSPRVSRKIIYSISLHLLCLPQMPPGSGTNVELRTMMWWEGTTRSDSLRGATLHEMEMELETELEAEIGKETRDHGLRGDRQTDGSNCRQVRTQDSGPIARGVRHASKSRRRLHGRIWTGDEGSKRGANFSSHLFWLTVRKEWMAAWAKKQQRRHRRPSQDRELDRTDRLTGPDKTGRNRPHHTRTYTNST